MYFVIFLFTYLSCINATSSHPMYTGKKTVQRKCVIFISFAIWFYPGNEYINISFGLTKTSKYWEIKKEKKINVVTGDLFWVQFFIRVHAALQPALSVRPSVGHTLLFFMILFLWPHCTCPHGLMTSDMAPAHPHATSVAVYPALLSFVLVVPKLKTLNSD